MNQEEFPETIRDRKEHKDFYEAKRYANIFQESEELDQSQNQSMSIQKKEEQDDIQVPAIANYHKKQSNKSSTKDKKYGKELKRESGPQLKSIFVKSPRSQKISKEGERGTPKPNIFEQLKQKFKYEDTFNDEDQSFSRKKFLKKKNVLKIEQKGSLKIQEEIYQESQQQDHRPQNEQKQQKSKFFLNGHDLAIGDDFQGNNLDNDVSVSAQIFRDKQFDVNPVSYEKQKEENNCKQSDQNKNLGEIEKKVDSGFMLLNPNFSSQDKNLYSCINLDLASEPKKLIKKNLLIQIQEKVPPNITINSNYFRHTVQQKTEKQEKMNKTLKQKYMSYCVPSLISQQQMEFVLEQQININKYLFDDIRMSTLPEWGKKQARQFYQYYMNKQFDYWDYDIYRWDQRVFEVQDTRKQIKRSKIQKNRRLSFVLMRILKILYENRVMPTTRDLVDLALEYYRSLLTENNMCSRTNVEQSLMRRVYDNISVYDSIGITQKRDDRIDILPNCFEQQIEVNLRKLLKGKIEKALMVKKTSIGILQRKLETAKKRKELRLFLKQRNRKKEALREQVPKQNRIFRPILIIPIQNLQNMKFVAHSNKNDIKISQVHIQGEELPKNYRCNTANLLITATKKLFLSPPKTIALTSAKKKRGRPRKSEAPHVWNPDNKVLSPKISTKPQATMTPKINNKKKNLKKSFTHSKTKKKAMKQEKIQIQEPEYVDKNIYEESSILLKQEDIFERNENYFMDNSSGLNLFKMFKDDPIQIAILKQVDPFQMPMNVESNQHQDMEEDINYFLESQ